MDITSLLRPWHSRPDLKAPVLLLGLSLLVILFVGREAGDFAISTLTFLAVVSILFDRQTNPTNTTNSIVAGVTAAVLGGVVIYAIGFNFGTAIAARCVPFVALLSWWAYRGGIDALKRHWRELVLLAILAIPDRMLAKPLIEPILAMLDLPTLSHATANLSAGMSWILLGIPVELDQTLIHTPNAIINVYEGCDGGRIVDFMIRLTLMLILAFPVKRWKWPLILFGTMILGYLVNVLRVTAMVYLADVGDMQAFEYWHTGEGSKIFNLLAIILFCTIGYFQITPHSDQKVSQDPN